MAFELIFDGPTPADPDWFGASFAMQLYNEKSNAYQDLLRGQFEIYGDELKSSAGEAASAIVSGDLRLTFAPVADPAVCVTVSVDPSAADGARAEATMDLGILVDRSKHLWVYGDNRLSLRLSTDRPRAAEFLSALAKEIQWALTHG